MKDASGELNLTVITLIAIAAVSAFFMAIMWPRIQNSINSQWSSISGDPVEEAQPGYIIVEK